MLKWLKDHSLVQFSVASVEWTGHEEQQYGVTVLARPQKLHMLYKWNWCVLLSLNRASGFIRTGQDYKKKIISWGCLRQWIWMRPAQPGIGHACHEWAAVLSQHNPKGASMTPTTRHFHWLPALGQGTLPTLTWDLWTEKSKNGLIKTIYIHIFYFYFIFLILFYF